MSDTGEVRDGDEEKKKKGGSKIRSLLANEVFPQLSLYRGREKLSRSKSTLVVGLLYISHSFSAWGDRMWGFVVSLFLVILYPGSLLLPAIFGFLVQLSTAFFGTLVGDWVDANPRMRVVWMSLLIQNSLVALCSVAIALLLQEDWGVCQNIVAFGCLIPLVIVFGSGANLATVANTISIEKDWVVVIADKNENTLAALNANLRRIDLVCKLVSPAVTGIFLQYTGPFATTIFVAGWNVVSFFGELLLVWLVYRMVPTLAVKKLRRQSTIDMTGLMEEDEDESEDQQIEKEEKSDDEEVEGQSAKGDTLDLHLLPSTEPRCPCCKGKTRKFCSHLLTPFTTLVNGWKIYMRQDIVLVGFSMASIYLTVLGFSGVTSAYFLTQGLRNDIIGVCQGIGAVFGVTGTVIFPFIRRRVGTVRAGLFGITTQWIILLLCIVAVAVPSHRISSQAEGYYSPNCTNRDIGGANMTVNVTTVSEPVLLSTNLCLASTESMSFVERTATPLVRSVSSTSASEAHTSAMATSQWYPTDSALVAQTAIVSQYYKGGYIHSLRMTSSEIFPTQSNSMLPLATPRPNQFKFGELKKKRFARGISPTTPVPPPCTPPQATPTPQATPIPSTHSEVSIALVFMLLGVICCRIGLWTFDLAVQQLVQEKVKEEERGVVSGVMNAMNSIMDMLHYVMVIAAPRPEHFRILTVISVGMITLGLVLYAAYVHKVRGHLFHVRDFCRWVKRKSRWKRERGRSVLMFAEEDDPTSFVNELADDETEELLEEEEQIQDDTVIA